MSRKNFVSIVMICGGGILLFVSLFADYMGIGDVDPDHFTMGSKQIIGSVFGGITLLAGVLIWQKK